MNFPMSSYEAQSLRAKALELAGDDHAVARRLLEMIAETNRTTLASLQGSVATASWNDVAGAAHRIAGSARLLACDELIALLTELEAAARERQHAVAGNLVPLVVATLAKLDVSIDAAVSDIVQH
jgi:HPt (histidine-containing phosphotransfer) domain-containing protein